MKNAWLQKGGPYITLLYAVMVFYFYLSGSLAFLVNPVYNKLIVGAAIILAIVSLYVIQNRKRYRHFSCDEEASRPVQLLMLALLITPLIFAVIFKPKPLSSASALLRGISSDIAVSDFSPAAFAKPSAERTLIEWVRILNADPEPTHHEGQEVVIEGSIILDEALPKNWFHIGRFLLTCCAADARSIALPVEFDPTKFKPENDQWVRLKGTMSEGKLNGRREVLIQLQSAETIPIPKNPYVEF